MATLFELPALEASGRIGTCIFIDGQREWGYGMGLQETGGLVSEKCICHDHHFLLKGATPDHVDLYTHQA